MKYGNDDQQDQGEIESMRRRTQRATQLRLMPKWRLTRLFKKLTGLSLLPEGAAWEEIVQTILRIEEGGDREH